LLSDAVEHSGADETLAAILRCVDVPGALAAPARGTRFGNEEYRDAVEIMYSALPVHEDAARLWEQGTSAYRAALRDAATHIVRIGRLTMNVDQAADLLWFCFGPAAWRTLVRDCRWSWDDAQRWLLAGAVDAFNRPAAR
jgi:hypothetical protein